MTNEDYNDMFKKWVNSKKLSELKKRKTKKLAMKILKNKRELYLEIEALLGLMEVGVIKADCKTIDKAIDYYRTHIVKWTVNLMHYEVREEFEACSIIKRLMDAIIDLALTQTKVEFRPSKLELVEITTLQELSRTIIRDNWDFKANELKNGR